MHALPKIPTGIAGFDELSRGGLPRHRTTLLKGGPGSGKTVFALQCLVNAVRKRQDRGLFVAFEESTRQIVANAATFDWGLPALMKRKLFFLDARLSPEVVHSGEFDLSGMLAMLKAKKEELGAGWIVFDGIDVLLTLLRDPAAEMREIYRIRDWLADNEMSAIITAKTEGGLSDAVNYDFMQFMVDCVVRLARRLEHGVALHRLQITKYRGSDFMAGEFPVSFGALGDGGGAARAGRDPAPGFDRAHFGRLRAPRQDAGRGLVPRQRARWSPACRAPPRPRSPASSPRPPAGAASARCSSASTRAPSRSCATLRRSASSSSPTSSRGCCGCTRRAPSRPVPKTTWRSSSG